MFSYFHPSLYSPSCVAPNIEEFFIDHIPININQGTSKTKNEYRMNRLIVANKAFVKTMDNRIESSRMKSLKRKIIRVSNLAVMKTNECVAVV